MASNRKGSRILAASRTGVPVSYDYEISDAAENRKGAWAVVIAVAIAFAVILQMEAEQSQLNVKRTVTSRLANTMTSS